MKTVKISAVVAGLLLSSMAVMSLWLPARGLAAPSAEEQVDIALQADRTKALERLFLEAVKPQIEAALVGVYGHSTAFWKERVELLQRNRKYPDVLRITIKVETYEGPHLPLGVDTIVFSAEPGRLSLSSVDHQPHPNRPLPR